MREPADSDADTAWRPRKRTERPSWSEMARRPEGQRAKHRGRAHREEGCAHEEGAGGNPAQWLATKGA